MRINQTGNHSCCKQAGSTKLLSRRLVGALCLTVIIKVQRLDILLEVGLLGCFIAQSAFRLEELPRFEQIVVQDTTVDVVDGVLS
jgi:hypothetical protein